MCEETCQSNIGSRWCLKSVSALYDIKCRLLCVCLDYFRFGIRMEFGMSAMIRDRMNLFWLTRDSSYILLRDRSNYVHTVVTPLEVVTNAKGGIVRLRRVIKHSRPGLSGNKISHQLWSKQPWSILPFLIFLNLALFNGIWHYCTTVMAYSYNFSLITLQGRRVAPLY